VDEDQNAVALAVDVVLDAVTLVAELGHQGPETSRPGQTVEARSAGSPG
jgi:hypothetical protein